MSFSDLYESGFKQRNRSHFASIVHIAMSDNKISEEEKTFLDRLARNLDIQDDEYSDILKNYLNHPINPPLTYNSRLERLYDLARMVYADDILGEGQHELLGRLSIGLGFTPENIKYVVDKALILVDRHVDIDTFIDEMKHMNR
ncbi:tellurite resistance TerB family protein [Spongiivirga citrea]|uniref:TerB family tellurite resistance protein n=1 Tax=Spongiivirga citrea TaxID=1481457 RepID=A0A6M0CM43_9FLAO|nr:TerB family tellurite resistance protein [Spongiivirga citrea]NER18033.1 TerB family tellurite resistance protein [Spongiivirga citrea]